MAMFISEHVEVEKKKRMDGSSITKFVVIGAKPPFISDELEWDMRIFRFPGDTNSLLRSQRTHTHAHTSFVPV